jgi:hypothetical protein
MDSLPAILAGIFFGLVLGWMIMGGRKYVSPGHVIVPREPTAAMLRGACDEHEPGQSMRPDAPGLGECPHFVTRRRVWREMVWAATHG